MVKVTWYEAVAFCQWLAETTGRPFRLPSEAEWEKAASWDQNTGQKRIWPWGDAFDAKRCNTSESEKGDTTTAYAYSPTGDSAFGATDMAGNIWEWTGSVFKRYPYHSGREDLTAKGDRVLRGGSFYTSARLARCTYRRHLVPHSLSGFNGFRVCVSLGL